MSVRTIVSIVAGTTLLLSLTTACAPTHDMEPSVPTGQRTSAPVVPHDDTVPAALLTTVAP